MQIGKVILSLIFFTFLSGLVYGAFLLSPTSRSQEIIRFVVYQDETHDEVLERLKSENLIRSKSAFSLISSLIRISGKIEPGAYKISKSMNTYHIAKILLTDPYQKWVTIVPGLRREQAAQKLADKFGWNDNKKKEFIAVSKEGYIFPETYLIDVSSTPTDIVNKFMNTFNEQINSIGLYDELVQKNIRLDTAVRFASLIERESGGDEDKALIAGIMWNRLDKNMLLQIDATLQYAVGRPDDWWPILSGRKLSEIESPYNTYKYKGLPPTAIASPSLASLKAVANPEETDCLFYLHARDKSIHCAVTYQEHLDNIDTYLR